MKLSRLFISAGFFIVSMALFFHPVQAQLTVTNLLRYQVIQRDTMATTASYTVTGTCRTGTAKILFNLTSQDSNKVIGTFSWLQIPSVITGTTWSATLSGIPIGGEYKAQFRALTTADSLLDSSTAVQNLLVGDIWLTSGQSNMQAASTSNTDPKHVHVRVMWYGSGTTTSTSSDTSHWGNGSAAGPTMSFANKLYTLTGVPIGIIYSAAGGTSLTDWFGAPSRGLFTKTSICVKNVCNWKIGGFLWYQGENEDQQDTWALGYNRKFSLMRDSIRTLSGNAKLPILAVQLESWDGGGTYALPFFRWPRWPIIRDQQELVGRADDHSAAAPIWDCAGLHINSTDQAKLGPRCAAAAIRLAYSNRSNAGAGPRFKAAWFLDSLRTKVVVQFEHLTGKLINPADASHLGFYVMKPSAFKINDSLIFNYDTIAYGRPAPMLQKISLVDTLGSDKVVITLAAATSDSLTVGYGRKINIISLQPVTDSTGIPLLTFFNRPIAKWTSETANITSHAAAACHSSFITMNGTLLKINSLGNKDMAHIRIFGINGKLVKSIGTLQRTINLREGLSVGYYLVHTEISGKQLTGKMVVF